jgi:signal transduction histidine kinase
MTEETLREEIAERKRLEIATRSSERLAAMGVMAAELAHEVRNPLGSIVLNLDLLLKEVNQLAGTRPHSPDEGRLLVNEIRAEIQRVQQVLEDYMQFARASKPQRRPLALNDFIEQKLAFKHYQFEQAGVNLTTDFDPSLTIVEADGEQVWQAVMNLIRNSLEAMPAGGELAVSTRKDGADAAVRVRDTGIGMSEDQLKHVYDPFFTTKASGTGLGLALVHQIVTEHGGHVECEGEIGKGSTFTIYLPLKRKP